MALIDKFLYLTIDGKQWTTKHHDTYYRNPLSGHIYKFTNNLGWLREIDLTKFPRLPGQLLQGYLFDG